MGEGFASKVSAEAGGFVPRVPFRGAAPAAALTARASFSPRGEADFGPRASFFAVESRFAAGAFVAGVFAAGVFGAARFLPETAFFAAASTFLATAGAFFAMAAFFAAGAFFAATLSRGTERGVGRRWAKGFLLRFS
jgi:hypothetical protein